MHHYLHTVSMLIEYVGWHWAYVLFGNVTHIWNKTCGKIFSFRWIYSEQTGKQTFATTLLSRFFTTVLLIKQGERSLVISMENWRDIIRVQFNPKILYFLSLLVKRNINENNTRSENSQIHKIIVIMLTY